MKKKLQTRLGEITVPQKHILHKSRTGFSTSPCLTELLCYMGQELVFETASEAIEKLTFVAIQSKQIERVCHHYGEKIEEYIAKAEVVGITQEQTKSKESTTHYVMVDGGMVLTREEKWKEMKLCRIFQASDNVTISKERNYITRSQYIAHLGDYRAFFEKVEKTTDYLPEKIVIADGAKWIWKWTEETYPEATQILDFYHAKEHLCCFANNYFKDEEQRRKWIDAQCLWLFNDGVKKVIDILNQLQIANGNNAKCRDDLVRYYQANQGRMQYKTYRENGWLIGSGAMEAAHRHVIQERMKLSGQRWTIKGAQQIANLRVMRKSNQWNLVCDLINNAA